VDTAQTLASFRTSLKPRHVNPHATLLTSYFNAVEEIATQHRDKVEYRRAAGRKVAPYIFGKEGQKMPSTVPRYSKENVLWSTSNHVGRDVDLIFDQYVYKDHPRPNSWLSFRLIIALIGGIVRYMRGLGFADMPLKVGLIAKEENTIIEKWPMRLKLEPPQDGAQEEFDVLLASGHTGSERYVEWKRV
jgi:hypothetical protein